MKQGKKASTQNMIERQNMKRETREIKNSIHHFEAYRYRVGRYKLVVPFL